MVRTPFIVLLQPGLPDFSRRGPDFGLRLVSKIWTEGKCLKSGLARILDVHCSQLQNVPPAFMIMLADKIPIKEHFSKQRFKLKTI